ncbi:hypothetical protein Dimus_015279 [Dionaea muscipula]
MDKATMSCGPPPVHHHHSLLLYPLFSRLFKSTKQKHNRKLKSPSSALSLSLRQQPQQSHVSRQTNNLPTKKKITGGKFFFSIHSSSPPPSLLPSATQIN